MNVNVELKTVQILDTKQDINRFHAYFKEVPDIYGYGSSQVIALGELFVRMAAKTGISVFYS